MRNMTGVRPVGTSCCECAGLAKLFQKKLFQTCQQLGTNSGNTSWLYALRFMRVQLAYSKRISFLSRPITS